MNAQVQRPVSVVNMSTVLEECITEEQHSVVGFCGQKSSMQGIVTMKCYLFAVGSVCRVKLFTAGSRYLSRTFESRR
jgi:hypothetical protein